MPPAAARVRPRQPGGGALVAGWRPPPGLRQDRQPLQDGGRRLSVASCSSFSSSAEITCRPAMKSPRPSASTGVSASTAHAASSGESRPAVSSAMASCMAAAMVSPGAVSPAPAAMVSAAMVSAAMVCPARHPPAHTGHRWWLILAPDGRSRGPGGGPASGGVGPGRPSCGPGARRPARAGHFGDGSSYLATRGQPRDCSRRRSANARHPEVCPGRARLWLGSGPAAPGSGRAPRRWRGATAVVPAPVARWVPGAGESAGPSWWHPRRGPVRD